MANWMEDAIKSFDPDGKPTSGVMVWVDRDDPDCGLGFVRFVLREDRERMIALLEGELASLKRRHRENAEGDDVLNKRIIEGARLYLDATTK